MTSKGKMVGLKQHRQEAVNWTMPNLEKILKEDFSQNMTLSFIFEIKIGEHAELDGFN